MTESQMTYLEDFSEYLTFSHKKCDSIPTARNSKFIVQYSGFHPDLASLQSEPWKRSQTNLWKKAYCVKSPAVKQAFDCQSIVILMSKVLFSFGRNWKGDEHDLCFEGGHMAS